jgi:hypothetical protein
MGFLVVEAGSVNLADGHRFPVGVHEVPAELEDAVKKVAAKKGGCYFTDKAPKGAEVSNSFVEQFRKQFPELGGIKTNAQKRDEEMEKLIAKKGERSVEEAEQGDVDTSDPAVNGERFRQGDGPKPVGPEAIAEKSAKN